MLDDLEGGMQDSDARFIKGSCRCLAVPCRRGSSNSASTRIILDEAMGRLLSLVGKFFIQQFVCFKPDPDLPIYGCLERIDWIIPWAEVGFEKFDYL